MTNAGWMRRHALFVAVTASSVLMPGGGAAPASAATPSCKGRDVVLRQDLVRVVHRTYRRPNGRRGHRYVACASVYAYPGFKRRRLRGARAGARLEFPGAEGAQLVVRDRRTKDVAVWNLATGRSVALRHDGRDPVGRVMVAVNGQAAGLVRTSSGKALIGFDYDGTDYVLDRGPVSSPSLRQGETARVSWTNGGKRKAAELSEPVVACAGLAGKRVVRTDTMNVVSFEYLVLLDDSVASPFGRATDGVMREVRGCALPGGPVRLVGVEDRVGATFGASTKIVRTAGSFLLVRTGYLISGDSSEGWRVQDLGTGANVQLFGRGFDDETFFVDKTVTGKPGTVKDTPVLTSAGQAAAVFASPDPGSEGEQLVGFSSAGRPRVLDTAPSAAEIDERSLAVDGTVLSWSHGAERRSADLAAP